MTRLDYSRHGYTKTTQRGREAWQSKHQHIKAWDCAKATSRQKEFIRSLALQAHLACDNDTLSVMSVHEASLMIEELKRLL